MEYRLDREVLNHIEISNQYEWLERNRVGAYSSSTVIGMNTRREHGLLVTYDKNTGRKVVVLSKFEESAFIDNRLYELSTNRYVDNIFPRGFEYLESFRLDPFPHFTYKIEDRILQKTLFLLENRNVIILRYELKNQGKPLKLILKPFLAVRYNDELLHEPEGFNTDSYLGNRFVRWAPKLQMPQLSVYYNQGEYISATLWYHNFFYENDNGREKEKSEALFNPGFFQVTLKPYETLDMFLSTEDISDLQLDYESLYRRESQRRLNKKHFFSFENQRLLDFQNRMQDIVCIDQEQPCISISAFRMKNPVRDIIHSIPGLLLSEKNFTTFKKIYLQLLQQINEGLLPEEILPEKETRRIQADLSLWLINLGYIYFIVSKDLAFFEEKVLEYYRQILDAFIKGTAFNIYVDDDGLVFAGDRKTSVSWIPIKNKAGETLRYGKLIEVNALWFNALRIMVFFSKKLNKKRFVTRYEKLSEKVKSSFNSTLVNKQSAAFYDFVNLEQKNETFRISQIIPLMLPFCCVKNDLAVKILKRIEDELLTPYGLRSLSIHDLSYLQNGAGLQNGDQYAYYLGAVWPWTIGFYVQACLNFKTDKASISKKLYEYFSPALTLADKGLLGYLPQAVFLEKPIRMSGVQDSATVLSNIVWAYIFLSKDGRKTFKEPVDKVKPVSSTG